MSTFNRPRQPIVDTHKRARKAKRGTRGWWSNEAVVVLWRHSGNLVRLMNKQGRQYDAIVYGLLLANDDEAKAFDGWADVENLPKY